LRLGPERQDCSANVNASARRSRSEKQRALLAIQSIRDGFGPGGAWLWKLPRIVNPRWLRRLNASQFAPSGAFHSIGFQLAVAEAGASAPTCASEHPAGHRGHRGSGGGGSRPAPRFAGVFIHLRRHRSYRRRGLHRRAARRHACGSRSWSLAVANINDRCGSFSTELVWSKRSLRSAMLPIATRIYASRRIVAKCQEET
jgi:hypothetical protein